jgi:hypothetical protein
LAIFYISLKLFGKFLIAGAGIDIAKSQNRGLDSFASNRIFPGAFFWTFGGPFGKARMKECPERKLRLVIQWRSDEKAS